MGIGKNRGAVIIKGALEGTKIVIRRKLNFQPQKLEVSVTEVRMRRIGEGGRSVYIGVDTSLREEAGVK